MQKKSLLGDCLADSFMTLSHSGKQLVHARQIPHPEQIINRSKCEHSARYRTKKHDQSKIRNEYVNACCS
jgi:hypothetical protein